MAVDVLEKPLTDIKQDGLDRKHLVRELCLYLTEPDQSESWRVALLGDWGSGKTSVCNWFRQEVKDKKHIVVEYSSCSAKTEAELFHMFYGKIYDTIKEVLERDGAEIGIGKKATVSAKKLVEPLSRTLQAVPKGVPYHATLEAFSSLVQFLPTLSKKDVEELVCQVPKNKSIIVIIDDLDRVEKPLIPRFLLFLRDLTDIKRISFLLPFDDKIIAHALQEYSTHNDSDGREYGENFLDKIIDYSVSIPETSNEQYFAFFKECLKPSCSFVVLDSKAQSLQDVLPQNPRKIKRLVRQIKAYGDEARRHHSSSEIDWHAVTLVELLKAESYQFTESFFRDFWEGPGPSADVRAREMQGEREGSSGEHEEYSNKWVEKKLDSLNISNTKKVRIRALCENIEELGGWKQSAFSYAFKLLRQSKNLTWREFDKIWDCWLDKKDFKEVISLLKGYAQRLENYDAKKPSHAMRAVTHEFINKLPDAYHFLLDAASHNYNLGEYKKGMNKAQKVLSLLDKILDEGHKVEGLTKKDIVHFNHFQAFWGNFMLWVRAGVNPADKDARVREEEMLKKWLKEVQGMGISLPFHKLLKDQIRHARSVQSDEEKKGEDLCVRLLQELDATSLVEEAINAFRKRGGIMRILRNKRQENSLIREEVLNPHSDLWLDGDSKAPGSAVLKEAENKHEVQENAFDLLALIEGTMVGRTHDVYNEEIERIFQVPQIIIALWNACIAQPVQFRALSHLRRIRQLCIKGGRRQSITESTIEEKDMIVPEWLKKGAE